MSARQVHAVIVLMPLPLFACASPSKGLFPPDLDEPAGSLGVETLMTIAAKFGSVMRARPQDKNDWREVYLYPAIGFKALLRYTVPGIPKRDGETKRERLSQPCFGPTGREHN